MTPIGIALEYRQQSCTLKTTKSPTATLSTAAEKAYTPRANPAKDGRGVKFQHDVAHEAIVASSGSSPLSGSRGARPAAVAPPSRRKAGLAPAPAIAGGSAAASVAGPPKRRVTRATYARVSRGHRPAGRRAPRCRPPALEATLPPARSSRRCMQSAPARRSPWPGLERAVARCGFHEPAQVSRVNCAIPCAPAARDGVRVEPRLGL